MTDQNEIVLASRSEIRRRLLESAGIKVRPVPSCVDESVIKRTFGHISGVDFPKLASALAAAKAEAVSLRHPAALVIGADQLLLLDERQFDKPRDLKEAAVQLALLRGKTHQLITAIAVARSGAVVWTDCAIAKLTMRHFSDDFLNALYYFNGQRCFDLRWRL